MLARALAKLYNAIPVRWQRRFLTAANARFLVGVVGLGVDDDERVLLARHRFGAPQWRFLGGWLTRGERAEDALVREVREETGLAIEVGPILGVGSGYPWARVELVFAYRVRGGSFRPSGEIVELRTFPLDALPPMRADQRGLIERHAGDALAWARVRRIPR